jgi:hypothetical protein
VNELLRSLCTQAHQPVALHGKTTFKEPAVPAFKISDPRIVIKKLVLIFLFGKPGEFVPELMFRWQERLLAMKDRRVGTLRIVRTVNLSGSQIDPDGPA